MKKNLLFVIALVGLVVVVFFIFRNKEQKAEIPADQAFAVKNVEQIDRVFLADKANNVADLRRQGDHWVINGKYKVMQPKMDVLLQTLEKVDVYYPVSNKRWDFVIRNLATNSTKVELYKKGEKKPFKVYHVGGNTEDSRGTFMIMEVDGKTAERPYITHIPGMEGLLNVRYFTDETEWRSTEIFDYNADEIKQVVIEYPEQPEHSFVLNVVNSDSFLVKPFDPIAAPMPANIYVEGVRKYLSSFEFLNAEAFENKSVYKDSVLQSVPFAKVSVTDIKGEKKEMTVYHMPIGKRSKLQFDEHGNKLPFDLDRYYAVINNGQDFVLIQDYVFGKIFRRYSDFMLQNKEV